MPSNEAGNMALKSKYSSTKILLLGGGITGNTVVSAQVAGVQRSLTTEKSETETKN